jgi:hypothetical protein
MKTLLLSLLLIIAAMLLIGSASNAQSKEPDREWIDSLAVRYRIDFIESAVSRDKVMIDSMRLGVDVLIFNMYAPRNAERATDKDLVKGIRHYDAERKARELRRCAYKKELMTLN